MPIPEVRNEAKILHHPGAGDAWPYSCHYPHCLSGFYPVSLSLSVRYQIMVALGLTIEADHSLKLQFAYVQLR